MSKFFKLEFELETPDILHHEDVSKITAQIMKLVNIMDYELIDSGYTVSLCSVELVKE